MDTEVDNGADDDKSDANTGKSRFKKDTDDAYKDTMADQDDSFHSKFKADKDGGDTDTGTSDKK